MLGRLNLSSLNSNVQHLVTTLSGHNSSAASEALFCQPTQVTYNQQSQGLSVSIGSDRSSRSYLPHPVQLTGEVYFPRGWAASHLHHNAAQQASASTLPLLELVSQARSTCNNLLPSFASSSLKACMTTHLAVIMSLCCNLQHVMKLHHQGFHH